MQAPDLARQFAAAGWSHSAAAELADIHLELQRRQAAEAAQRRIAERAAVLAAADAPLTPHAGRTPPWPWRRLLALAIVTALLYSLAGCGGGGSEDEPPAHDVNTPRVDCTADPRLCT